MSPVHILFVCTGNICRSPMAEYLARSWVADAHLDVETSSAGLALQGEGPTDHALAVMSDRGIDMSRHLSRKLTPEIVGGADLILGMTSRHAREAIIIDFDNAHRVYTLREFARLIERHGARPLDVAIEPYLLSLGSHRPTTRVGAAGQDDDIEDPYGRRRKRYVKAAREIEEALMVVMRDVVDRGSLL